MKMEYKCVQCGSGVNVLFVQYSPGNIRLMKCENCKAVADEYIECELMILLIDLILHKPKAYRHLLYNVLNQETVNFEHLVWKSILGFLLLDTYRSLLLRRSEDESGLSVSFSFFISTFKEVFVDVFLGNFIFVCTLILAMRILGHIYNEVSRLRDVMIGILISSYFKILLIAMMVWEFPSSVVFIIDLFVISSNTVALKVLTKSPMNICIAVCFSAHAVKFVTTQAPDFKSLRYLSL